MRSSSFASRSVGWTQSRSCPTSLTTTGCPRERGRRCPDAVRAVLRSEGDIDAAIRDTGDLSDELIEKLNAALAKFKNTFNIQEEAAAV